MGDFSVLLPVYAGDEPRFFARALRSVSVDQELRPAEIVLVRDGPVGPELAAVVSDAVAGRLTGDVPVHPILLRRNVGLARALDIGLVACAHEIVARADADDISLPSRFRRQIPVVEGGVDLLGSAITEFVDDETTLGATRTLPTEAPEIAAMARFRDPFNHPSVVYRRSAVAAAGGYQHLDKMEDYWLFARMIAAGASVANLAEPLVLYRVGAGAYDRRGGRHMLGSELRLQFRLLRSGFVTWAQALRNVAVRGGYRLIPTGVREGLYRRFILRGR